MIRKIFIFLRTYFLIYAVMIVGFIALLVICAALPKTNKMINRFRKTAVTLEESGGDYYCPAGITMDGTTDALFLNISYNYDQKTPWKAAMLNDYRIVQYPTKSIQVESLRAQTQKRDVHINPEPEYIHLNYWRYWYGQCAILKLLHYLFPIQPIYGVLAALLLFLFTTAIYLTIQKAGLIPAISLFSLLCLANIQFATFSLAFQSVFVIGLTGLIWLLWKGKTGASGPTFFILGMLCAYFDSYTAPLLAVGIPGLIICGSDSDCMEKTGTFTWKNWSRVWLWYPAVWLGGYILSWLTKILIGGFVSGSFHDAIQSFTDRIGTHNASNGYTFTRWEALSKNLKTFMDISGIFFYLLCAIFVCLLLLFLWKLWKGEYTFDCKRMLGYLFFALIPLLFMLCTANHVFIHHWMTYRNIPMSIAAVFLTLTAFRKKEKNPEKQQL